jgi:mannitol 2-dehydrogenase
VGVQLVADVEPYELMKLRLLNASHQALCYPGYLAGYRFAHEVCADPAFVAYLTAYMDGEATPTLRPVPGIDLAAYKRQLIERFANPAIRDTLARLCAESSDRIPKWVVPVIADNLAAGRPVRLSAAIVASWARYAEGRDEQGAPIEIVDQRKDRVIAAGARQRAGDRLALVRDRELFGDLAERPEFTEPYLWALDAFGRLGARATIEALVERSPS